jgi:hypothetical protein
MESEVLMHTFGDFLVGIIKIDDIPSLILASMISVNNNSLSFNVFTT